MELPRIAKDVLSFGADWRIRRRKAEFDDVCQRREIALQALAWTRDNVNRKVEHLIATKMRAIEGLRMIRRISKNLEAKSRTLSENRVTIPSMEKLSRIESTIGAAEIAKNSARGLAAGASTALGTWALIGTYGTASTGTAISGLSGAAASNAILAWLGGGSIAAGGGGIAAGTVVLGGIVLIPIAIIAGAFSHLSASKKIKEIDEQIVYALADIKQVTENRIVLQALGKRLAEVDVAIDRARAAFEVEVAHNYKLLFPFGFLSKIYRYVRSFFGGGYFSETDVSLIAELFQMAQALARLIDQRILDDSGKIL